MVDIIPRGQTVNSSLYIQTPKILQKPFWRVQTHNNITEILVQQDNNVTEILLQQDNNVTEILLQQDNNVTEIFLQQDNNVTEILVQQDNNVTEIFLQQDNNVTEILLQQDNARPHRNVKTQKTIPELGWTVLPQPPRSLDLAPSHFHLF